MKKAVVLMNLMILLLGSLFVQAQQVVATNANAVPPPLINFSGTLTDANGKPVTSTVVATFCLYSEQTGGAVLWMESQNVQPDATGHYTVMLGSTSSAGLPSEMFIAGQAHWLGVQVQGEQEQPRVLLVSAPYALKAGDAQTLGGLPASAFVLAAPTSGAAMSDAAPASTSAAPTASVSSDTTSDVTTSGGTVDALPLFSSATNIQNSIVTQTGTTAVNVAGRLNLPASGTATSSAGFNSRPLDFVASSYDSGTAAAVAETFQWQANAVGNDTASPSATLNLLFGSGTSAPAQTGLNIASNGLITFAKGQTFPGTGKGTITGVTAGTDLTGGGTSGSVTLNLNTSALNSTYAQLGAANAFTGNQTITGDLTVEYSGSGTGLYLNAPGAYYGFQAIGDAIGALGNAVATGGDGVYGQSNSSAGTGVVGSSANVGVDGQASGTSAGAAGVYGDFPARVDRRLDAAAGA